MQWFQIFQDGPEYEARRARGKFTPPDLSLKQLQQAIPRHLFKKSTLKSTAYLIRHLFFTYVFFKFGTSIDALTGIETELTIINTFIYHFLRPLLWIWYWGWQGITFAGLWCLGHEAGHNALSPYRPINTAIGLAIHTFVLTPYYSWRVTHTTHHKSTNNLDRDETYIPPTRKHFKLPDGRIAVSMDYVDMLEETPAFTLFKLFIRQFLGFQLYLLHNRKGNPNYPPWTSHYLPSSKLFQPRDRALVIASNITILCMLIFLVDYGRTRGWIFLCAHYLLPWLFAHNWIVLFTYLQHSDPTIPYYRSDEWTFARGALATVDRPLFGWVGRFFLHNISSDHVAHHFFPSIPFCKKHYPFWEAGRCVCSYKKLDEDNLPKTTEAIVPILGDYYNYDSTPALYALWRSFTQCTFVEDEGFILFFKNQRGEACIELDGGSASRQ